MPQSHLEREFQSYWNDEYPDTPLLRANCEVYFAKPRRWRFDFAFPEQKLAIEMEGGTWVSGRHSRGAGMTNDCEKYNYAVSHGWAVFRFTSDMWRKDARGCVTQVKTYLDTLKMFTSIVPAKTFDTLIQIAGAKP